MLRGGCVCPQHLARALEAEAVHLLVWCDIADVMDAKVGCVLSGVSFEPFLMYVLHEIVLRFEVFVLGVVGMRREVRRGLRGVAEFAEARERLCGWKDRFGHESVGGIAGDIERLVGASEDVECRRKGVFAETVNVDHGQPMD